MSYNTQFKVKYREIEEELCLKLKDKTEAEYNENSDEENEYTSEDVIDICHKLYIDEFISVFNCENIVDDKIDLGMKYVFEQMCLNIEFNNIVEEMTQIVLKTFLLDDINSEQYNQRFAEIKQLITLILFSQNIFHITHKCICQQFKTGTIDDGLLVQLKSHSLEYLKKQYPII
jgi:hypothetical protein